MFGPADRILGLANRVRGRRALVVFLGAQQRKIEPGHIDDPDLVSRGFSAFCIRLHKRMPKTISAGVRMTL